MADGDIWLSERDVFAFLDLIDDGSIDLVLTDLPYPTTERHRNRGTTTRTKKSAASDNPWYSVLSIDQLADFFDRLWPKLAPQSAVIAYVDTWTWLLLAARLDMVGDLDKLTQPGVSTSRAPRDRIGYQWRQPLTWGKTTLDSGPLIDFVGQLYAPQVRDGLVTLPPAKYNQHRVAKIRGGTGHHGQMCTELALYLEKGDFHLQHNFLNLALEPRPQAKPKGATHRAASPKPVATAERLTRALAPPDGLVVDPFVGCGTHAVGISRAGRTALVNDRDTSTARDWLDNVYNLPIHDWPD